jgi:D-alanyl-D-alanine carboxypeptidase
MLRMRIEARRGLRVGASVLALVTGFLAVSVDPADARRRYRSSYNPASASIVVDANTGKVLHAENADALRHPASLTKIMTLYLLFEQLEAGRFKLNSPLKVSEEAAEQAPTKLGVKPDQTIDVETAIKAMITRSANDVAVVIAENLAEDEEKFAELMTRKAKSLGMSKTVYKNASGLPDDEQVTTARDQAILGRAIQERFPRHYKYFALRAFEYRGVSIRNHNRLLGRVDGVDGIKTGYTRASGFNLVTSVHRDGRYIVAVVLGGRSGASRDATMHSLISQKIRLASTKRTAPMIAEARDKPESPPALAAAQPRTYAVAAARTAPVKSITVPAPVPPEPIATAAVPPNPVPEPGSTAPIRPVLIKTLTVKPGSVQTAAMAPVHIPAMPRTVEAPKPTVATAPKTIAAPPPPPGAKPGVLGVLPARNAIARVDAPVAPAPPVALPPTVAPAPAVAQAPPAPAASRPQVRSGWVIQVGAYTDEGEAKERLSTVRSKAGRILDKADPFTEPVKRGDKTWYRARFAGFDQSKAEAACKHLKRNDVECMALRN